MNGLLVLIPVALGLGLIGLAAFFWSLRGGQFDDLDGAALRSGRCQLVGRMRATKPGSADHRRHPASKPPPTYHQRSRFCS